MIFPRLALKEFKENIFMKDFMFNRTPSFCVRRPNPWGRNSKIGAVIKSKGSKLGAIGQILEEVNSKMGAIGRILEGWVSRKERIPRKGPLWRVKGSDNIKSSFKKGTIFKKCSKCMIWYVFPSMENYEIRETFQIWKSYMIRYVFQTWQVIWNTCSVLRK